MLELVLPSLYCHAHNQKLEPRRTSIPNYGKLVDNFIHESDVTFLQDPFSTCFPGIEPMFDPCVCFGLLFTLDNDLGCTFIFLYGHSLLQTFQTY